MKRMLVGVAVAMMAMALVSCGGGGGGGTATGLPVAQLSPPSADVSALAQPGSSKSEVDQAAVQGLVAQQADQGGGLSAVLAQGPEGRELIKQRITEAGDLSPSRRRLFAYLPATSKIASIPNPNPAPGQDVTINLIFPYVIGPGGYKYGVFAGNLAYDARRDRLYVPINNGKFGIIKNASEAKGDVLMKAFAVPTPMDTYSSIYLDVEGDTLWIVGATDSSAWYTSIVKIKGISTVETSFMQTDELKSTLHSSLLTVWHVRSSAFTGAFALDVKRSMIYKEYGAVFDLNEITPVPLAERSGGFGDYPLNTTKAWTTLPVRQFFDSPKFLTGVALDTVRDRLYFIDSSHKQLLIVDGASVATGAAIPVAINLPDSLASRSSLTIDEKNDRLYIGGARNDAYIINKASSLNAESIIPASYVFAEPDPAATWNDVWGIAIPQ